MMPQTAPLLRPPLPLHKKTAFPGPLLRTLLFPCTSMKEYQKLITDWGRPNLMMSFWGTVTFVRLYYIHGGVSIPIRVSEQYPERYQKTIPVCIISGCWKTVAHTWVLGLTDAWFAFFFQLSAELHNQIPSLPGPKNTTLIATSPN